MTVIRFPWLAAVVMIPAFLCADQEALDALAQEAQTEVDSEAVSVYGGKVGNADAIFFIEWAGAGSQVEGRYYLLARGKDFMYVLKGSNPKSGVLEFEDFLEAGEGNLVLNSACTMTKRVSDERIVWEGEKTYESGHVVPISFSRPK